MGVRPHVAVARDGRATARCSGALQWRGMSVQWAQPHVVVARCSASDGRQRAPLQVVSVSAREMGAHARVLSV